MLASKRGRSVAKKDQENKALNRRSGEETRSLILDVAEQRFSRWGYTATTLDEIAEAVGIRRPSLLYHFPDKLTLYRAVIERLFAEFDAMHRTRNRAEFDTLGDYIDYLLDTSAHYYITHQNYLRIDLHNLLSEDNDTVNPREIAAQGVRVWKEALEEGFASGQFRRVHVGQVFAVVGGILSYYTLIPDSVGLIDPALRYDPMEPNNRLAIREMLGRAIWGILRAEESAAGKHRKKAAQRKPGSQG